MNSGVFIERNGILNLVQVERHRQVNPLDFEQFVPNPAAVAPLRLLKEAGLILLATTNQPGLSLGHQLRRELDLMHDRLRQELPLDDILVCPHDASDHCPCRKPKPGLLLEAAHRRRLNLERSFVLSDKWQDAAAAHYVGCVSILVASPWSRQGHHDFVVPSLAEAVARIIDLYTVRHSSTNYLAPPGASESYMPMWADFIDHCAPMDEEAPIEEPDQAVIKAR